MIARLELSYNRSLPRSISTFDSSSANAVCQPSISFLTFSNSVLSAAPALFGKSFFAFHALFFAPADLSIEIGLTLLEGSKRGPFWGHPQRPGKKSYRTFGDLSDRSIPPLNP